MREERYLDPFSIVSVSDNVDLVFVPGAVQKIEVEAGKNLIPNITTEVSNYQLTIKNNTDCNWMRSYDKKITVYVTQPYLIEIYNHSYGKVSNTGQLEFDSLKIHNYGNGELNMNIKCDKLWVDTNFLGDVILSGEATEVDTHCFRLARLDTRNLKCQDFTILSEAEGDHFVYAENSLTGTIKSIGNVHYYGNPVTTNFQDLGEGNFIKN